MVLKGRSSILFVEIIHSQYGEEALNSCNPFEIASPFVSSGPWIPIMPDSHEEPDLDRKWQENDEDNSSRASRRED
jgi:hypothetical protein